MSRAASNRYDFIPDKVKPDDPGSTVIFKIAEYGILDHLFQIVPIVPCVKMP